MWFGTGDGLKKFNGYTFQSYKADPKDPKNTLRFNFVYSIYEDSKGRFWVGSHGLQGLNKHKDTFTAYFPDSSKFSYLNIPLSIHEDEQGMIWFSAGGGLNRFNPQDGKLLSFPFAMEENPHPVIKGLQEAFNTIPDIIISDVMMPEMDGIELCKKLKTAECTSHIPIILLTANAGETGKLKGLEIGADDYMTKPFRGVELKLRVNNLVEGRKSLRKIHLPKFKVPQAPVPLPIHLILNES